MGLFTKKKKYIWNQPNFAYARGYRPSGIEQMLNYNTPDFMGYGKYQGYNSMPNYLELLFQDRDILDTDYRVMDPYSQKWQDPMEDMAAVREYLNKTAQGEFARELSSMDDVKLEEFLRKQKLINDVYEYGDPYSRSLYYTPYDVALGYETGFGGPMVRKNTSLNQNAASIHPNVDYNFWNTAHFTDVSKLPGMNKFNLQTTPDISYWHDPSVSNPGMGFISETNPWASGVDYDYDQKKKTVKTSRFGGLGSFLGPLVGFATGMPWLGAAIGGVQSAEMGNWKGALLSMLPYAPGFNSLTSGLKSSLGGALFDLGIDSNAGNLLATDVLFNAGRGGVSSAIQGQGFLPGAIGGAVGTTAKNYVMPEMYSSLASMGLPEDAAYVTSTLATDYGSDLATDYLTSLGDSDTYTEPLSRTTSKATPGTSNYEDPWSEGLLSGFGLPMWLANTPQQQQKTDTAKGKMTNNQIGSGFDPDKATQFITG